MDKPKKNIGIIPFSDIERYTGFHQLRKRYPIYLRRNT